MVICAHTMDRWDDILAAANSVRTQQQPAEALVIVVDHNPELHRRLRDALPDVEVVENRRSQGLSGARNTGIDVTDSDVIVFLDDDAVAAPDWLSHLSGAFTHHSIAGVGGTTLPRWDTAKPSWFPDEFYWTIGCSFTGRQPGEVRNLLGGNASFRREVFAVAGGFPENMGRNSADARPLGAEETELCIRATQWRPAWRFLFEPRAVIWHRIPEQRARFDYFRSRCYAEGLSKAALVGSLGARDGLSEERRYVIQTLTRGFLRGVGDALKGDWSGILRSGAIVAGLFYTGTGYVRGRFPSGRRAISRKGP